MDLFTTYTRWNCPTQEHDSVGRFGDAAPPVCHCGHLMVDANVFTDQSKPPPMSADGWIWNIARGPAGMWERFDSTKHAVVSRAELETLAKVIASTSRDNAYRGNTILVAAGRTIERLAHPKSTLRIGRAEVDLDGNAKFADE